VIDMRPDKTIVIISVIRHYSAIVTVTALSGELWDAESAANIREKAGQALEWNRSEGTNDEVAAQATAVDPDQFVEGAGCFGVTAFRRCLQRTFARIVGERVAMRRETRIAQRQERWLAQQEQRRQRKMKSNSLPGDELCHHLGANNAAAGERNRRDENDARRRWR
jgi:hypothetical protein